MKSTVSEKILRPTVLISNDMWDVSKKYTAFAQVQNMWSTLFVLKVWRSAPDTLWDETET